MRGAKPASKPLGDLLLISNQGEGPNIRTPTPPKSLPEGIAHECWNEVTREMILRNTYDGDCRDMVEAYCVQRARFIEANEQVHSQGLVIKNSLGSVKNNPYVYISNNAYDRMVRLASELGLTPVRRDRVGRVHTAQGRAGAEKFLKGGL